MSEPAPPIRPISSGDLEADGTPEGDIVAIWLRGSAELGARTVLDDFFTDVLCASTMCREVVVDIRELEYMNSSSFKSLLSWIVRVRDLPEGHRHKIRFLSNPELHWQKRSLHSLVSMCGDVVEVEEHRQ